MKISDMFSSSPPAVAAPASLPGIAPGIGELLGRLLVAQMPRMSAWALRPDEWPKPYTTYDQAMGLEQVGAAGGNSAGVVRLMPATVDPATLFALPANTNK